MPGLKLTLNKEETQEHDDRVGEALILGNSEFRVVASTETCIQWAHT